MDDTSRQYRIGILTYHNSYNYGAFLQAFALCSRLNQEPCLRAEIIDFDMPVARGMYDPACWSLKKKLRYLPLLRFQAALKTGFQRGRERMAPLLSRDSLCSDSAEAFATFVAGKYNLILVGSDEIWKLDGARGFPSPYWLPGVRGCRKASYAASSRSQWEKLPEETRGRISALLADFALISTRDQATYRMAAAHTDPARVMLSCDPSFLYDIPRPDPATVYRERAKLDGGKKKILLMLDDSALARRVLSAIDRKRFDVVAVFKQVPGCVNVGDLDPFEWLALIEGADFVIASFFHAVCYSILSNTPFLAVATEKKKSKLSELLEQSALADRLILDKDADWSRLIAEKMTKMDNSAFVAEQRENFSAYLERLYGVLKKGNAEDVERV